MKIIGRGIQLKEDLPLETPFVLQRLAQLSKDVKPRPMKGLYRKLKEILFCRYKIKQYQSEMVRHLINVKKVKWKHIRMLPDILKEYGMYNKKGSEKVDAKEKIRTVSIYLSAMLGMTPHEIEKKVNMDDVQSLAAEVGIRQAMENMGRLRSQHDPKNYGRELVGKIQELRLKRGDKTQIGDTKPIDTFRILHGTKATIN